MKQSAVEWLYERLERIIPRTALYDIDKREYFQQAKEMDNEQKGYSEEEVLNFTQTMIMQYKFGNTNIEQMDLLKETLQKFKNK